MLACVLARIPCVTQRFDCVHVGWTACAYVDEHVAVTCHGVTYLLLQFGHVYTFQLRLVFPTVGIDAVCTTRPPHKWPQVAHVFFMAPCWAGACGYPLYCLITSMRSVYSLFVTLVLLFNTCCYHTHWPTDYGTPFRSGRFYTSAFGVSNPSCCLLVITCAVSGI